MTVAAVTGWALRTPLGVSVDDVVSHLLASERAAQPNGRFPSATYPCRLAATIPADPARSKHARVLRRMGLFGIEVALEALHHASQTGGTRLGLFAAVGGLRAHWNDIMPALAGQRDDLRDSWSRGFKNLHPFWMLQHLSNNAHALLAAEIGAKGDGVTFGGANAGAQALVAATHALQDGAIDTALVVSYDSLVEPEILVEMAARGALATCDLDALGAPYDAHANGVVPGEAAAALVLVSPENARQPLAHIEPVDTADGEKSAPRADTLRHLVARIAQNESLVDGCSFADRDLDGAERQTLGEVVGPSTRLTSIQSATGYLGAPTALVQIIALATLLRTGRLPPIAGLREPLPGPLHPVEQAESTLLTTALAVSAGAPGLAGAVRLALPPSPPDAVNDAR